MNLDEFWALVEASDRPGAGRDEREDFLRQRLSTATRSDLLDFVQHLSSTREPANTYRLWRAADVIMGGFCGGDSFHYFQMWLVGLGRKAYSAAIDDPDCLAEVPQVRGLAAIAPEASSEDDDFPEWESLEYVACEVGEERDDIDGDVRDVVTDERGVHLRMDPDPHDEEWALLDSGAIAGQYPRLWALFGDRWSE